LRLFGLVYVVMNRTAVVFIFLGLLLLGGFVYLKSRPVPEVKVETTDQGIVEPESTESASMKDIKQYDFPPEMTIDTAKQYVVSIVTSKGNMKVRLLTNEAPVAVNNFVFLAKDGFYDETKFHRVMSGFMIQGGDPNGDGTGGPGYKFADEKVERKYTRGIVAMANSGPDTNGSQFFVMHKDYDLPPKYVIFGELVGDESFATLDAIAETPVVANVMGEMSKPKEDVILESMDVVEE